MTDRPILFSAPMVRALLDGRKTQTRRIIKPQPDLEVSCAAVFSDGMFAWMSGDPKDLESWMFHGDFKTPIQNGDRLWVRESWKATGLTAFNKPSETRVCGRFAYMADAEQLQRDVMIPWRPSIHMPRWASRLTLIVTDVRVERLQDISEADAIAEGCFKDKASGRVFANEAAMHLGGDEWNNARDWYADLWETINGAGAWDANPWVAAYTFTVHHRNIDEVRG